MKEHHPKGLVSTFLPRTCLLHFCGPRAWELYTESACLKCEFIHEAPCTGCLNIKHTRHEDDSEFHADEWRLQHETGDTQCGGMTTALEMLWR